MELTDMEKRKNNALKSISIVSAMTILSRIFGFLRDLTFFSSFGVSLIGSAFLMAFSVPNLFRRLLGEGAPASALIPILSSHYAEHGKDSMLKLFSHMILRLFVVLGFVFTVTSAAIGFASVEMWNGKWNMALWFAAVLLPYMIFVCLAAIVSAALNVLGRFFVSSVNQVWMNLTMILSMLVGKHCLHLGEMQLIKCLMGGVLLGGVIQLAIPLGTLFFLGWRPRLDPNVPNLKNSISDVLRMFLPGIFGASIEQFNVLITRTIAYSFDPAAVSLLYMANRLVELPTGVFGLAITTVFFPRMARIIGSKADAAAVNKIFSVCLVAIAWILLPSAIGLFALKEEILSVFFEYGNLTADSTRRVLPILSIYCVGMVFSGTSSFFIRGFHSTKNTKTPAFVGAMVLIANASLSLLLVRFFGAVGLAAATTSATILQATVLFFLLKGKTGGPSILSEFDSYLTIFCGCVSVAIAAAMAKFFVAQHCHFSPKINSALAIFASISLASALYLLISKKLIVRVWAGRKERKA
jgi:putative peptidoglycan lipid II flippase